MHNGWRIAIGGADRGNVGKAATGRDVLVQLRCKLQYFCRADGHGDVAAADGAVGKGQLRALAGDKGQASRQRVGDAEGARAGAGVLEGDGELDLVAGKQGCGWT